MRRKTENQPENAYVYSSSELGKYYGITVKGMEFYENKGLIHPERFGSGRIRRFTLGDTYRLYLTRLFKNCGIGIPQTLELLEAKDMETLDARLGGELKRLEEDHALQRIRLDILEHMRTVMLSARDKQSPFEVIGHPGFRRLFVRRFMGPHESNSDETLEFRRWNDCMPIAAASLRFPLEDCREDAERIDTGVGLIIEETHFQALDLGESPRTRKIPAGRFLHTVLSGDAESLSGPEWLSPALRYMRENGLRQTGDAFTRFLCLIREDSRDIRYDEAWFPIE